MFEIPNSDLDMSFALRARSVWHFESDRGEMRLRVEVVTPVARTSFAVVVIFRVFIRTTTNNLTFVENSLSSESLGFAYRNVCEYELRGT